MHAFGSTFRLATTSWTQDAAMMNQTRGTGSSYRGLKFEGAGRYMSRIIWQPSDSSKYLCYNNDFWHGVTWEGLSFKCNTTGAGFMHSIAEALSSDFRFDDCTWDGNWGYGIALEGTNVNSEWGFIRCNINGSYSNAFLYSGIANHGGTDGGQDQQLNYSFYECDVTLGNPPTGRSTFLNFAWGGGIRIWGGDYIMIDKATAFVLQNAGHASGVQSFMCQGVRFEIRTDNGMLISSHWGEGLISFSSCDNSSAAWGGSGFTATTIMADFYSDGAYQMPAIEFENCNLQGRHRYNWSNSSSTRPHNIVYRDCRLAQYNEAKDFIVYAPISGASQSGGTPAIHFENCRGTGDQTYLVDCTVGWNLSTFAMPKKQFASIKTTFGTLPHKTWSPTPTVVLPLNAMILAVHWYKKAGVGSSNITNWGYTLATSEGTPTTIASVATGSQWASAGFRQTSAVDPFVCDSDAKRTLRLTATNITQTTTDSFCVVEYLA
jgi:hypothetical protein